MKAPARRRTARLSRREFARALRLGLGRARIDVRRHGLAGREDLLVAACLRNATLWPFLEGSLSSWLLAIARDGGAIPLVRRAVFAAAVRPIANRKDVRQTADLVGDLADDRDAEAQRVLLRMIDVQKPRDVNGACQAIWVLGEAGLLHVARSYGHRWQEARGTDLSWIAHAATEEIGARRAFRLLRRLAKRDARVRPFLAAIEPEFRPRRRERDDERDTVGIGDLEQLVCSRRRSLGGLWRWSRRASRSDRAEAWRRIFLEKDPRRLCRRLHAFDNLDRPRRFDPRLLRLASHRVRRVRVFALSLVAAYRDPRIRSFALRRLRADAAQSIDEGALDLLQFNARAGDAALVAEMQPPGRARETSHDWARSAEKIAERRRGRAWDELLLTAYEFTPCRSCREFLLKTLVARKLASPEMLREALFDANDDVRRVARKALGR